MTRLQYIPTLSAIRVIRAAGPALLTAALALGLPQAGLAQGSAASDSNRSIVGGIAEQATEAGRTVGSEARKVGRAIAQGAREAASTAASGAKQVWTGAKEGAHRAGVAASSAVRDMKSHAPAASQPPAPVETRSTTR